MTNGSDRVVVVGGGVAGLATALALAPMPVTVLVASPLGTAAATGLAQGGIAAALGADDAPALHAADTLTAGAGLSDPAIAALVAEAAPAAIDWLVRIGTPFDRDAAGAISLGLEAAHNRRRIAHAGGDATGRVVLETLIAAARATPSITVVEGASATALLCDDGGRVRGVAARRDGGAPEAVPARAVVLATGGLGGLYGSTTNPLGATGQGLALAGRAGAVLRDMEFVQFHPTAIAAGGDPMPLATEALRGEGAILVNGRGERFMRDVAGRELAPRDVVARAIFAEIARGERVFLDTRPALGERFAAGFPAVAALCRAAGIDPAREPIPVRPAAHYHMGGVKTDDRGRTSLDGLWAAGEVASTGLHGANRLASNSLLEGLVFGRRIAEALAAEGGGRATAIRPAASAPALPPALRAEIRVLMDRHVGVLRDEAGLTEAVARLGAIVAGMTGETAAGMASVPDMVTVATAVAVAALDRRESRGGHARRDHPLTGPLGIHAEITLADALDRAAALAAAEPADKRRVA
ncbi:L-aspartate oxidase [Pseudoxanthobacter soli DSM 19599]|uniref:L-aspartate oxidase n=1 Tax=Pseudoxanthobacter soli DSM 19599 TaxID=1123029 RepID=A0A1M7ZDC9_9HYPH|nr:L-aspartate oxidase [Pseudoxanthobacter soli]SHO62809.1 L-aspartate oxidase [Pseudoxanthobacter soli DSM 19599]